MPKHNLILNLPGFTIEKVSGYQPLIIDLNIGTLRNWEQERRETPAPAKTLLRAINKDPEHVSAAFASDNYKSPSATSLYW